jgi:hypothetical protein
VSESKVVKRMFGPKREAKKEDEIRENYIVLSFIIFTTHHILID